jgi:hypothetical protein
MRVVIGTIIFNFICISIFCMIYFYLKEGFINNDTSKDEIELIDFIMFTTTVQAGVGITSLTPNSVSTKVVATIQQLIMITSYVFVLYLITL